MSAPASFALPIADMRDAWNDAQRLFRLPNTTDAQCAFYAGGCYVLDVLVDALPNDRSPAEIALALTEAFAAFTSGIKDAIR